MPPRVAGALELVVSYKEWSGTLQCQELLTCHWTLLSSTAKGQGLRTTAHTYWIAEHPKHSTHTHRPYTLGATSSLGPVCEQLLGVTVIHSES